MNLTSVSNQMPLVFDIRASTQKTHAKDSIAKDFSDYLEEDSQNLHELKLLTAGVRQVGNEYVSYSVYWSENSTPENPVFLAVVKDSNGKEYEMVEIALNNIEPHNVSLIELLALRGYNAANGLPPVRTLYENEPSDIFTKFDYLKFLLEHMETQRRHGNMQSFWEISKLVDQMNSMVQQTRKIIA